MYSDGAIKRMENSSIGELRTRELLIDRYWILERYIDFEGADTLIQRKMSYFGSIYPTRLGIIQSKFRLDITEGIEINGKFVLDEDKNIRNEFFLFVHTGFEDKKKTFFLTAEGIVENFKLKDGYYKVIVKDDYEIDNIKNVLEKIQSKLESVDLVRNRTYVADYFTGSSKIDDILEDYNLRLTKESEEIIDFHKKIKSYANECLKDIYSQVSEINEIMHEKDPSLLREKVMKFLPEDMDKPPFYNMDEIAKQFGFNVNEYLNEVVDGTNIKFKDKIETDIKNYDSLSYKLKDNEKYFIKYLQEEIYKEMSSFKRKRRGKVYTSIRVPYNTYERLKPFKHSTIQKNPGPVPTVVQPSAECIFLHFLWDYDPAEKGYYDRINKAYFSHIYLITDKLVKLITNKTIKITIC